ncbi:Imidazole glycerol phosphate synthase subunit HisH 1 [compost metagenome]
MGWNDVAPAKTDALVAGLPEHPRYYFVHSYHFVCNDPADALLTTSYGGEFVSAVRKGNIMGVQFHPEKSHKYGMALLKNFAEM